ncbi:MAG TPA: MerR family transcriptional regulator [Thiotrichales bacterium]|nr:MerR family transcriptional regulator [Thiotrichales bacterium]
MIRGSGPVAQIVDEELEFSLAELCRACMVSAEEVICLVEEGLLEPEGRSPREWRFPGSTLRRLELALRLERDFRLNPAGAALAVELLEEIRRLRRRLSAMERGGWF